MPAIYHEGSWLGNATDPEVLVKDTVGWTGKNLLELTLTTITKNGVTATVNNGVVSTNGTSGQEWVSFVFNPTVSLKAGKYILSGISGGSPNTYRFTVAGDVVEDFLLYDGEQEFTTTADGTISVTLYIRRADVDMSGKVFYPMLRKADITDPTYEPYHESVEEEIEQVYADNGVLGAKNLLENKATTQTVNGITYTVNSDGSIAANGTATASADLIINQSFQIAEKCILSGCPVNGSGSTYRLMYTSYGGEGIEYADTGNGVEINNISILTNPNVRVVFRVSNGQTVNNITIKPMVRLASDPDDTYQPYAMTNRELTEKKINIADLKTVVSASSDFTDFKTRIASL